MSAALTAVCAGEFILLEHHPELSRRPQATGGRIEAERRRAALTWNVFRTLELIAPAFWLRRVRARLDALTPLGPVDRTLSVRLWATLPTPSIAERREPVCVDVIVETDSTVYGVLTFEGSDVAFDGSTLPRADAVLRAIDAVSWYAGARDCYVALVTSDYSDTPIGSALIERYRVSRDALLRRLPHRRDGLANLRGIGRMTWRDVASIVRDCAESAALTDLERFAASRTVRWLHSAGIRPTD